MKWPIVVVLAAITGVPPGQMQGESSTTPQQLVRDFFKFEAGGGRLTTEGWREANKFFVDPIAVPPKEQLYVIDQHYAVWDHDRSLKDGTVRVTVGVGFQGQIDSELRLIPVQGQGGGRVMLDLTQTKHYWEPAPDGKVKEVTGLPQWRIKPSSVGAMVFLETDTAIRYVREMRQKATDPAIRRNADKTIATLSRYR